MRKKFVLKNKASMGNYNMLKMVYILRTLLNHIDLDKRTRIVIDYDPQSPSARIKFFEKEESL